MLFYTNALGAAQDDARREFQLWRSTAKEGHPLQRFGTGNLFTLKEIPEKNGTNIREHLLRFTYTRKPETRKPENPKTENPKPENTHTCRPET